MNYLDLHGQIHGSVIRDMFIDRENCNFWVSREPEEMLRELVEEGRLVPLGREPTISQRAFQGLCYNKKAYKALPWGTDTIEEYWYKRKIQ